MTIAERIYSASTSEDAAPHRLAEKLARKIEDDIVLESVPAGRVMGSLRELSERYSAGRAAAREAVALLERRGLGRLRPGPCGGFVVTEPECRAIGVELANHFRLSGVTLPQVLDACEAVDLMAASLVAARPAEVRALASAPATEGGLNWHLRMRATMAAMTGEPVVELFALCLNELAMDFAPNDQPRARPAFAPLRDALAVGDATGAADAALVLNADFRTYLCARTRAVQRPALQTSRLLDDRTLSTFVARKLAAEILQCGSAGERLGSEWDLCERFSVSRATFRQAVRQLQDSGLVEGRRGRGNGLVVRNLRGTGTIKLVVAYLIGRQMDPTAAGTILFQINRFVPALALHRADDERRARLRLLLDRAQRQDPIDRYDLLALVQCVSELADSPIIDLFSRCLAAYEARFHPSLVERLPATVQAEYFGLLRDLLEQPPAADCAQFAQAKSRCGKVMLEMSLTRPL